MTADELSAQPEPAGSQLWMVASDVFHIPGRGTVVTGRLAGFGLLSIGDLLVCAGLQWPVARIQHGQETLTGAEPDSDIGVLLAEGPAADVLRGQTVEFRPSPAPVRARPPGGLAGRVLRRRG